MRRVCERTNGQYRRPSHANIQNAGAIEAHLMLGTRVLRMIRTCDNGDDAVRLEQFQDCAFAVAVRCTGSAQAFFVCLNLCK